MTSGPYRLSHADVAEDGKKWKIRGRYSHGRSILVSLFVALVIQG